MNFNQKIEDLLSMALEEYPNIFLVDLKISADKSIKLILDGDEEINVKDCINISRAIEGALDRDEEDFSLEVASAGVGSPLKFPRQYHKNLGRKLEVVSTEGLKFANLFHITSETQCGSIRVSTASKCGKMFTNYFHLLTEISQ